MRREDHGNGVLAESVQALDDFGVVAVTSDVIGLEIVGRFAEKKPHLCLAAGTGNARFRVRDQMRRIDDSGLDQGEEAELDGGWIAAGIADDARLGNGGAMHGSGVARCVPAGVQPIGAMRGRCRAPTA